MSWKQAFLSLDTTATGPQLDQLVNGTGSATERHRHSETDLWVPMPTAIGGWIVVVPCAYMLDVDGFIHMRGIVNGMTRFADNIFDWPAVPDVSLQPEGLALAIGNQGTNLIAGVCVLQQNGSELSYQPIPGETENTTQLDIGSMTYFAGLT